MVSEIYDVMLKVCQLSVTAGSDHVQLQCRQVGCVCVCVCVHACVHVCVCACVCVLCVHMHTCM